MAAGRYTYDTVQAKARAMDEPKRLGHRFIRVKLEHKVGTSVWNAIEEFSEVKIATKRRDIFFQAGQRGKKGVKKTTLVR